MFFKKSTFALAFVALASIASAATTPACLLSVIGDTNNPANLVAICGDDAKKTESAISDQCGSGADSALKFFANTCTENGHKVVISDSSNSTSTSGSATATGTGFTTAVSTSGSQATGSGSGASNTSSSSAPGAVHTGAAISDRQLSGTTLAAAVFVGVAAWL
ncbi:uncharacterized protein N7498_010061 [Penicillium cinerascens]|uniref:GPI anchored cell wall protein n=1 Tax=Penicillium cinerascens TaxID=70096 RepID=A0A9W9J893_9EURO|nr:uncharacterized protein N7498_010061 [Penicillium cinerascens]KAJ5191076.1 hypothetical protein N7498_010061 [Penicillium cinerascens]